MNIPYSVYVIIFTLISFIPLIPVFAQAPDTVWTKKIGDLFTFCSSVQQTTDGGYIIIGGTESYGAGGSDVWLIKTNSSGDTLWTKTLGDTGNQGGGSGQQTTDGGYIIAGHTSDQAGVGLIKTNSSGDTLWTKILGGKGDGGGSGQQTTHGGYIIAARTDPGDGTVKVWLIKLAPLGTAVEPENTYILTNFVLSQNYPNPFNPSTKIKFELPKSETVKIEVYNILGQKIETTLNKHMPAGYHEVEFNGLNLSSGIYLYRIEAGEWQDVKKMILLR